MLKFFIKTKRFILSHTLKYHSSITLDSRHEAEIKNRTHFFDVQDFHNASVLDIGCGIGSMSLLSLKWGAREVLGIEYDRTKFQIAEEYCVKSQADNKVTFICDDIHLFSFWNMLEPKDVTLFLPVIKTGHPKNTYGDLARLAANTKKVMYLEGSHGEDYRDYFNDLLTFTDFNCIEYKGENDYREDGASRPFFRCARESFTQYQAAKKIKEFMKKGTYNKIAVVGKAASGKTHIKKMLAKMIDFEHDYEFVDDKCGYEYPNSLKKIVFFVYTGLKIVQDIEAVFFINIDENVRRNLLFRSKVGRYIMRKWFGYRVIHKKHYLNHSPEGNMNSVRAVNTIKR